MAQATQLQKKEVWLCSAVVVFRYRHHSELHWPCGDRAWYGVGSSVQPVGGGVRSLFSALSCGGPSGTATGAGRTAAGTAPVSTVAGAACSSPACTVASPVCTVGPPTAPSPAVGTGAVPPLELSAVLVTVAAASLAASYSAWTDASVPARACIARKPASTSALFARASDESLWSSNISPSPSRIAVTH